MARSILGHKPWTKEEMLDMMLCEYFSRPHYIVKKHVLRKKDYDTVFFKFRDWRNGIGTAHQYIEELMSDYNPPRRRYSDD